MGRSSSRSHSRSRSRSRSDSRDRGRRRSSSRSRSPASDEEDNCRVHIADLGLDPSKTEIQRSFEKFGRLREIWVARIPPCFAFVVYKNPEDAQEAVRKMDGESLNGKRIRVSIAKPRMKGGHTTRGSGRSIRCYVCLEYGHFARDCARDKRNKRAREKEREKERERYRSRSRDRRSRSRSGSRRRDERHSRRRRSSSRDVSRDRSRERSRSRDRGGRRSRDRSRDRGRRDRSSRDRRRSSPDKSREKPRRSRERSRERDRKSRDRSRERDRKSKEKDRRSKDKDHRSRERSRDKDRRSRERSRDKNRKSRERSRDKDRRSLERSRDKDRASRERSESREKSREKDDVTSREKSLDKEIQPDEVKGGNSCERGVENNGTGDGRKAGGFSDRSSEERDSQDREMENGKGRGESSADQNDFEGSRKERDTDATSETRNMGADNTGEDSRGRQEVEERAPGDGRDDGSTRGREEASGSETEGSSRSPSPADGPRLQRPMSLVDAPSSSDEEEG